MARPNPPVSRVAGASDAGRNCPYCRFAFKSGVDLVQCGVCAAPHHADCWADNGGCAIIGCEGAPAPPTAAGQRVAPIPPPPSPPSHGAAPVPGPPGPPPVPPRRSGLQPAMIAVLSLVIVASIAVAALALSGNIGGDGRGTATSSDPPAVAPPPAGGDGETEVPRPLARDRNEIAAVLRRYETAYTNHDTAALRFVFTPTVTRHGLAGVGCGDASGRDDVLDQYRQQFALGTGTYTLRGMAPSAISVDGDGAHTDLRYSIQGGRSGSVSFDLERFRSAWRVARVDSHCRA